ncbi:MAM and LDL-receptor class A domain-containing protein 2 [Ixodes scapularis]
MDLMMKVNGQQVNIWSLRYVYPLPDERTWWHARILLGRYAGDVKLYFAAFGWPWKEGYFAIDEISYAFCGLPPKVASCNVQEFRCANGACIPQLQVCNYVDNCGDGSDEVNCGDHNSGCNFDASFCDWKPIVPAGGVNPGWIRKKPGGFVLWFNNQARLFNQSVRNLWRRSQTVFYVVHGFEDLPPRRFLAADGAHPNFLGVAVIAEHLRGILPREAAPSPPSWSAILSSDTGPDVADAVRTSRTSSTQEVPVSCSTRPNGSSAANEAPLVPRESDFPPLEQEGVEPHSSPIPVPLPRRYNLRRQLSEVARFRN